MGQFSPGGILVGCGKLPLSDPRPDRHHHNRCHLIESHKEAELMFTRMLFSRIWRKTLNLIVLGAIIPGLMAQAEVRAPGNSS